MFKGHRASRLHGLIQCVTLILVSGTALAQGDQAGVLEEIVVTAQKREQNIQDVGISITALSQSEMKEMTFFRTEDVVNQVPSLEVTTHGTWTIRGVGSSWGQSGFDTEQKSATSFDDIYWYWSESGNVQMFDMAQVEVLKGPQGTLFGRNATGGLVHFRTREPTEEFEAYLNGQFGDFGLRRFEGALSGGLTDSIRARVAVVTEKSDGWVKNRIGPDLEDMDMYGIRLKVNFDLPDGWSGQLGLYRARADMKGYGTTRQTIPSRLDPATGLAHLTPELTDFLGWIDPDISDPWTQSIDPINLKTVDSDLGHFRFDYDGDYLSFAIITSYMDGYRHSREDVTHSPNDFAQVGTDIGDERKGETGRGWTHETRFSGVGDKLTWVAGTYFIDIHSNDRSSIDVGPDFFGDFCICSHGQTDIRSISVFGQVEYMFAESWRLTTGLRWTEEETRKWEQALFIDLATGDAADDGFLDRERENDENIGARLALDFIVNDNLLLYASYNRGAKAGGFNGIQLGDASTFDDEVLDAFEIGMKSTLLGGRATFNGGIFFYDYNNYQARTFRVIPGAGTAGDVVSAIFNQQAEILGLDFDLRAQLFENTYIVAGLSLLDGKVFDLNNGVLEFPERKLQTTPDYSANIAVTHHIPLGNGGRISLHANTRFSDDQEYSEFNHPATHQDAYHVVNASIGYQSPEDRWSVSVWGKNLTNEIYMGCGDEISEVAGITIFCVRPPRWVGATVNYNF